MAPKEAEKIKTDYLFILITRKVPATSEKQLVLSQRILYYLRNLLAFAVGIDELERN